MPRNVKSSPVAVIGMACRYPDARNPLQFWENILARRRAFRLIPDVRLPLHAYHHPDRQNPDTTYARLAALIDGFTFDWSARRIPRTTMEAADIVHWLALETALAAVADAGYAPDTIPGERTGVVIGNTLTGEQTRSATLRLRWPFVRKVLHAAAASCSLDSNQVEILENAMASRYKAAFPPVSEDTLAGGLANTIAGRICYYLNLFGGGYTVDGACSSSLLATATAMERLAHHDLDLAVVGGVDISLDPFELVGFAKTGALSPGDMHVYDQRGMGFIPGEGCGFVVLKRLEDAQKEGNTIYAALQGWGISSDGRSSGITAPSVPGQVRALEQAYGRSAFRPSELDFIEGHGTGTAVGDRTELSALATLLAKEKDCAQRRCGVTSLKSIIGHTKAASGIGGLIKAIIAVNRRIIPPTAGCRLPHPIFADQGRTLYPVLFGDQQSDTSILRAGVSSMGFGGINCHITLTSADPPHPRLKPDLDEAALMASSQESELFILTGDDPQALCRRVRTLTLEARGISMAELTDLACELSGKAEGQDNWRAAIVAGNPETLLQALEILAQGLDQGQVLEGKAAPRVWCSPRPLAPRIGLLFPGQGSQQLNMARTLIQRHDWARDLLAIAEECSGSIEGQTLGQWMARDTARALDDQQLKTWRAGLADTRVAQPAVCLASVIWLKLLQNLGLEPEAVAGHSLGEVTAFYAAGAIDLPTLMSFAALRGRLMAEAGARKGTMAALRCNAEKVRKLIREAEGKVFIANENSPRQTVVSGLQEDVKLVVQAAAVAGIEASLLPVSGAFHSELMALAREEIARCWLLPDRIEKLDCALFSSFTGGSLQCGDALSTHLADQITAPVRFNLMIQAFARELDLMLEVGPGRVLSGLTAENLGQEGPLCLPVEGAARQDQDLNIALAELFIRGASIHWPVLYDRRLIRLFQPAEEKNFIVNPCETPLDEAQLAPGPSASVSLAEPSDSLWRQAGLSGLQRSEYLHRRGEFLAKVIQADLESLSPGQPGVRSAAEQGVASGFEKTRQPGVQDRTGGTGLQGQLTTLIQEVTGFAPDTINMAYRLLDDLNLDSIKAADVLSRFARQAGVRWPDDPVVLANATLGEIVAAVARLKGEAATEADAGEISGNSPAGASPHVFAILAQVTGFEVQSLDSGLRLVDDLNLDSIKIADVLTRAAQSAGCRVDAQSLEQAPQTIADLVSALERHGLRKKPKEAEKAGDLGTGQEGPPGWVRNFNLKRVREAKTEGDREHDWSGEQVLIVYSPTVADLARKVQRTLEHRGARAKWAVFEELDRPGTMEGITHCIVILDQVPAPITRLEEGIRQMVTHLAAVTTAELSPLKGLAFVQFGGGYFGRTPGWAHANSVGCAALAAGLHHEHPGLRVRVVDLCPDLKPDVMAGLVLHELETGCAYEAAGFDSKGQRWVLQPVLSHPADYTPRPIRWQADDVILVSGGGKGITAECALAAAKACGASLVLLGSSPLPERKEDPQNVIHRTLARMENAGIRASYYACDITRPAAVRSLIKKIRRTQGPIRGLIHGAGINHPRSAASVPAQEAWREIQPKVLGLLNLWQAMADEPPDLVVGLSSIIGITGMPGNVWYGFANEILEVLLQAIEAQSPATRTQSVAFSIWGQTGMGVRMGSVSRLAQMGIDAIPTGEGGRRFADLFTRDPGSSTVVVTARLGGLDTWRPPADLPGPQGRFSRNPVLLTPGVEAAFKTHLDLKRDLYLADHVYQGSCLFPTVFGLEAMAQAAFTAAGITAWRRLHFERIELRRPITVDPQQGAEILIWARVAEKKNAKDPLTVRAGIRKIDSGLGEAFFSATLVVDEKDQKPLNAEPAWTGCLPLVPVEDLYRESLLFQGPRFQRIEQVLAMEGDGRSQGVARLTARRRFSLEVLGDAFATAKDGPLVLPDPFFSDALLQSAALLVPQDPCLPVAIDRLDFHGPAQREIGLLRVQVTLMECRDKTFHAAVRALDGKGRTLMGLEGYCLKILKHVAAYPTLSELKSPAGRDLRHLNQTLDRAAQRFGLALPEMDLEYLPGIHEQSRKERRLLETPLIENAIERACRRWDLSRASVVWQENGRPVVGGMDRSTLDLSLSHDARLCMAVAGPGPQGCDVAPVTRRSRDAWINLLGQPHSGLLEPLMEDGDSLDQAGTRVWAALEAARKASGLAILRLMVKAGKDGAVLFETRGGRESLLVLTHSLHLTWGGPKIVALAVGRDRPAQTGANGFPPQFAGLCSHPAYEVRPDGPSGELIFVQRFPVTFKPGAQLSRNVYFTNFFDWMGHAREASTFPVMRALIDLLGSGRWGSVTNYSRLQILGEARTGDLIQVRMWTSANGGPQQGTMTLQYDFTHLTPQGRHQRLAFAELQTTWVELIGHGLAKPAPYPQVLQAFFDDMIPKSAPPRPDTQLPASLGGWQQPPAAAPLYQAPSGPVIHPGLRAIHVETSQGQGNAVGNIYYAKYYDWQGKLRDHYLQALIPEYFGGTGERGEALCLNCRVDHLREAMPFDPLKVTMALKTLWPTRAVLYFEYFRAQPGKTPVKLAYGTHEMVWVVRNGQGEPQPAPFPEPVRQAFEQAIARARSSTEEMVGEERRPVKYLAKG